MVIQFPKQKRQPSPRSQQANPVGLYLLLAFILLYGASVFWVQHQGFQRSSLPPTSGVAVNATQNH